MTPGIHWDQHEASLLWIQPDPQAGWGALAGMITAALEEVAQADNGREANLVMLLRDSVPQGDPLAYLKQILQQVKRVPEVHRVTIVDGGQATLIRLMTETLCHIYQPTVRRKLLFVRNVDEALWNLYLRRMSADRTDWAPALSRAAVGH